MHNQALITLTVALLAILNPIGNAAIYASIVSTKTKAEKSKAALVCAIAVMIILVITTWAGLDILKFFGISIGAFQGAGGVVVLLIGLSMIRGKAHTHEHDNSDSAQRFNDNDSVAVVPLAMPIIAGPGAITALIAHMKNLNSLYDKLEISLICIMLAILVGVVLFFAPTIGRVVGESGMKVATRIMGLILTAIAFDMLASGMAALFPGLMQ